MIKITRLTDYALVLLTAFAEEPEATRSAKELAEETRLPLPMAMKILKLLTHQGLLESQRGARGGYQLARRPIEITISDVVTALEGPIAITTCAEGTPGACEQEGWCRVRQHWQMINQAVCQALSGITLADLARPLPLPIAGV